MTSFSYKGIVYSILDGALKTACAGLHQGENNKPSAVSKDYASALNVQQFVFNEGTRYEVVEVGSFACSYCTLITAISLPSSIVILRAACFDECHSVSEFTIQKGSYPLLRMQHWQDFIS